MQDFITIIGILSPICAIVFGYATFTRNKKSDTTADAKQDATVLTEIGYIKGESTTSKPNSGSRERRTPTLFPGLRRLSNPRSRHTSALIGWRTSRTTRTTRTNKKGGAAWAIY